MVRKSSLFLVFWLVVGITCSFGQTKIDPWSRINWAGTTGSGAPSATCPSATVTVGTPYWDNTNSVNYTCGASGWVHATATGAGLGDPGSNGIVARTGLNTTVVANAVQLSAPKYGTDTGAVNAYVVGTTPTFTPSSAVDITFYPTAANTTTTPTINVNGSGAITIVKLGGALAANDMLTNVPATVQWNSVATNWILKNPQTGTSSLPTIGSGSAPLVTAVPSQPGQTIIGSPKTNTFTTGFPTAGSIRGTAIAQNFPGFNCALLADVAAQQFCTMQLSLDYNSGIASLTGNQVINKYNIWWNFSGAATISNALNTGTHTLVLNSGGYGPPPVIGGNGEPYEARFGYAADSYDQHTTTYNGSSNAVFNTYNSSNNTDTSCYALAQLGQDCTITVIGHHDNQQYNLAGTQQTATGISMHKFTGWETSLTAPITVYMYNSSTSAFVPNVCPGYSTNGPYSEPVQQVTTDFVVYLLYNHTLGSFSCAINDGAASSPTSVTLANDTGQPLVVGVGYDYIQSIGIAPTLLNQSARAQFFNNRYLNKPPLFDTASYTQLDQYQFGCSDFIDQNYCTVFSNGLEGGAGTGVYQATSAQAHTQFQINSKRIYISADPGLAIGVNHGIAVHVNGVLQCYDMEYSSVAQNFFTCDLGNSTNAMVTVDVSIGAVTGNTAAGSTWTALNSGYQGLFLNSIFYPKNATFIPPSQMTAPSTVAMMIGDSIPSGTGAALSPVGTIIDYERYAPGGNSWGTADVALHGAGSLSLWNNCPTQVACTAWLTSVAAGHNITVWIDERGANDFLHACSTGVGEGLANYTLALGYLMTAITAVTPSAHLYEAGVTQLGVYPPTAYDGCSGSTNTVAAYNTAKSTVCTANSSMCTYYDMTNTGNGCPALANTGDYYSDNVHLTEQGARKWVLCMKTYLSATNPTSINYLKY